MKAKNAQPGRRVKVEPAVVLRIARQPGTAKLIASASLKLHRRKIDRFSLIGLREVANLEAAKKWARNLARAADVRTVEIEQNGLPLES